VQAICATLLLNSGWPSRNHLKGTVPNQQSGMSTGSAHAPVKDALSRPITAGGFVDGATSRFADVTYAGRNRQISSSVRGPKKDDSGDAWFRGWRCSIMTTDGWLDIYLLEWLDVSGAERQEAPPRAMLLHNNHDGTFTDVTEKAGVANERWGLRRGGRRLR